MDDMNEIFRSREPPDLEAIRSYRGHAHRMRGLANSIRNDMEWTIEFLGGLKGGHIHRKEYAAVLSRMKATIDECEAEARAADAEVEKLVQILPKDGVLYAHYARGLTWEQVAEDKFHCLRYIYKLRKKELEALGIEELKEGEE